MTVLDFPPPKKMPAGWQYEEVQKLLSGSANALTHGDASGWDLGKTDAGDPQLYLLGPGPDFDCILCVSRLGRLYVLEDGSGRVLFEHQDLSALGQKMRVALNRRKMMLMAKVALLWATIRHTIEEKIEPLLAEPMELATHIAPQIAALA